jgi:lysyl-tRNA synthetase class 2
MDIAASPRPTRWTPRLVALAAACTGILITLAALTSGVSLLSSFTAIHHHRDLAVVFSGALLFAGYRLERRARIARHPEVFPGAAERARAERLIRLHGADTLAFFKLRGDHHYLFSADGRAFVGYGVKSGHLIVSGDPVGPAAAMPALMAQLKAFAAAHGLRLIGQGISESMLPHWQSIGMATEYFGDEAVIDVQSFSLEGRPIRKVRQSVNRMSKAGYSAEVADVRDLDRATLSALAAVVESGRHGAPEIGFSWAMEGFDCALSEETVVVYARDGGGAIRGLLHFVPCFGRNALSMSLMRTEADTPNGLTEYLVVKSIELLRERGIAELSLNFSLGARYLREPETRKDRVFQKLAQVFNPVLQMESLYKFNAKFFPRWEPRYGAVARYSGIPRALFALGVIEGQWDKLIAIRGGRARAKAGATHAPGGVREARDPAGARAVGVGDRRPVAGGGR